MDWMGLRDGGQGLVSVAPLVLLPTDNHEACAPISVPLGRGCTPARQPAGEGEHGVSRVLRGREHTAARLLHPSNHHAQRLPTEMQDKSSHWRRRRELDMGYGPWPPGRARALGCRQAAAFVINGAVGLVPVEIELVSCVCPLEPLSFCLWQLSCNPSPKESFVGRFRHTVALSAPALHAARAHHAGGFTAVDTRYSMLQSCV